MDTFPPPHRVLYERLNDRMALAAWTTYKAAHSHEADFDEVDAANMNSMDDFAKWVAQWMTFTPTRSHVRCRILMVWHAHLLSLACQQMLRRSLEQRSFRCRVWFHIEEPNLQPAIVSRCIVTALPEYIHDPIICGPPLDLGLWIHPRGAETEFQTRKE